MIFWRLQALLSTCLGVSPTQLFGTCFLGDMHRCLLQGPPPPPRRYYAHWIIQIKQPPEAFVCGNAAATAAKLIPFVVSELCQFSTLLAAFVVFHHCCCLRTDQKIKPKNRESLSPTFADEMAFFNYFISGNI